MNKTKEEIMSDIDKYQTILNGLDQQLITLVLTDIIASLLTKDEQTDNRNYDKFDEIVNNIKGFLNCVEFDSKDVPNIKDSIQGSIDNYVKMQHECQYSLRALEWVRGLLEKQEKVEGN